MSLSINQIGPVFVASFVAFGFVGGIGLITRLGEQSLGYVAPAESLRQLQRPRGEVDHDEDVFQYEAQEEEPDEDEEERAREIRNAVFGSASAMW